MTVTVSVYNHTAALFLSGGIDIANLKAMLLDNTASFVATNVAITDVAGAANAKEISGNGWDAGGEVLANSAVTTVTTNDALLDADDIVVTATGGDIGPAYSAVIYDATNNKVLKYIDFGQSWTAGDTTDFKLRVLSGLFSLDYTA